MNQHAKIVALGEALRDYVESAEFQEQKAATAELIELMAEICQLPDEEQHTALVWWARSPYWEATLMLLTGWQGKVARAAWRALKRELETDTHGRRWWNLDWKVGRASIERLLGISDSAYRVYAGAAFRTWIEQDGTDEGRSWIAGAIGSPPILTSDALLDWNHMDIQDVVLWDPRTNEVRFADENPAEPRFVLPNRATIDGRLTVWADGAAYFRAWAALRARKAAFRQADKGANPFSEDAGTDLPGGLFIGDIRRARWPGDCGAATIVAGPGLTAAELHMAAIRAANLPQFMGGAGGRG